DAGNGQNKAEIGGHKLLQREQLHHAVVNFNLQLVDGVFFAEDGSRQLFVRIEHRMNRLMHGSLGQAAHPKHALFQLFQIAFEMAFHIFTSSPWPSLHSSRCCDNPHPKRPVIYASVRGSEGVVNMCPVGENSIRSPFSMKAVESLTRAACCMLWVTITKVHDGF